MELKIITPPAAEPLSTAEVKLHLRVDHNTDDTLITALIATAREWVESYTGKSLVEQTRQITLSSWPYAPLPSPWRAGAGDPNSEVPPIRRVPRGQSVGGNSITLPSGKSRLTTGQTWPSEYVPRTGQHFIVLRSPGIPRLEN